MEPNPSARPPHFARRVSASTPPRRPDLQADLPGSDLRVQRGIERHVGAAARIVEVHGVADLLGSNPAAISSCLRGLKVPVVSSAANTRTNTGRA